MWQSKAPPSDDRAEYKLSPDAASAARARRVLTLSVRTWSDIDASIAWSEVSAAIRKPWETGWPPTKLLTTREFWRLTLLSTQVATAASWGEDWWQPYLQLIATLVRNRVHVAQACQYFYRLMSAINGPVPARGISSRLRGFLASGMIFSAERRTANTNKAGASVDLLFCMWTIGRANVRSARTYMCIFLSHLITHPDNRIAP